MTEHNRIPARQIIVYGDCWPVTIAVAHLVRRFMPGCNCETAYRQPVLLQQLRRKPEAILILCLRPREHLFLFYSLRQIRKRKLTAVCSHQTRIGNLDAHLI